MEEERKGDNKKVHIPGKEKEGSWEKVKWYDIGQRKVQKIIQRNLARRKEGLEVKKGKHRRVRNWWKNWDKRRII